MDLCFEPCGMNMKVLDRCHVLVGSRVGGMLGKLQTWNAGTASCKLAFIVHSTTSQPQLQGKTQWHRGAHCHILSPPTALPLHPCNRDSSQGHIFKEYPVLNLYLKISFPRGQRDDGVHSGLSVGSSLIGARLESGELSRER